MKAALVILLLFGSTGLVCAQGAFETIDLQLSALPVTRTGQLNTYWKARTGVAARAEIPFHRGHLSAGLRVQPFRGRGSHPNFWAATAYAGWGRRLAVRDCLVLSAWGHLGSTRMAFDDATTAGIRNESEFMAGVMLAGAVSFSATSSVAVSWSGERIFTRKPLTVGYLVVAYRRTFETPAWLRRVLE